MNVKDKQLLKMAIKMQMMMIIMAKMAVMRLKLTVKIRSYYGMRWEAQRY